MPATQQKEKLEQQHGRMEKAVIDSAWSNYKMDVGKDRNLTISILPFSVA